MALYPSWAQSPEGRSYPSLAQQPAPFQSATPYVVNRPSATPYVPWRQSATPYAAGQPSATPYVPDRLSATPYVTGRQSAIPYVSPRPSPEGRSVVARPDDVPWANPVGPGVGWNPFYWQARYGYGRMPLAQFARVFGWAPPEDAGFIGSSF